MFRLRLAPRRIALIVSFLAALGGGALVGTVSASTSTTNALTLTTVPPVQLLCTSTTSTNVRGNSCRLGTAGAEATKNVTSYTNTGDPNPACRSGSLRTAWYQITGTGHRIHLTTLGSNYDTVLAIFPHGTSTTSVACNDDFIGSTSDLNFASTSGAAYDVMVGQDPLQTTCPATTCNLVLGRDPDNDDRAFAATLAPTDTKAVNASVNNKYADTEVGENLSCTPIGGSAHTIGHTAWYKVTTASSGVLDFFATGFSSVLAVYVHGSSTTPLACGASASNDLKVHVSPGTYDLQLGGNGTTFGVAALHTDFTSDSDQDKDGFTANTAGGSDCNDHSAAIHPGALDIPNDKIDQNCDGHDAIDADHDGVDAPPDGADCNDASPSVHPGAKDVPGDGVDQDCNGKDAKFPVLSSDVGITYLFFSHYTKLTALDITKAKKGSKVKITCKGHGCPFKSKTIKVKKSASKLKLLKYVKTAKFAQNSKLTLALTSSGQVGRIVTLKFRNNHAPKRTTQCQLPNKKKPQKHC